MSKRVFYTLFYQKVSRTSELYALLFVPGGEVVTSTDAPGGWTDQGEARTEQLSPASEGRAEFSEGAVPPGPGQEGHGELSRSHASLQRISAFPHRGEEAHIESYTPG